MKLNMIGNRGHWGYVFQSIKDCENIEITAICAGGNDDITNVVERAKEFGFSPKVYEDYLEMLDTEKPDIVCVDGPYEMHATYSISCLERNINVFCEKPIALTIEDLDKLELAYNNSSAKIFSMIGIRYEAAFQTALNLVREGAVGKVKIIYARKSYKLGERAEHFKKRATYGGTIPWVGSHAIDWIMVFGGCSKFSKIYANDTCEDNFNNGELEIAATVQYVLENGVLAQASIDYLRPATASTHGDDQVRVAGTEGVIEVKQGKVYLIDAQGEREIATTAERKIFSDIVGDCMGKKEAWTTSEESIELTRNCILSQQVADNSK